MQLPSDFFVYYISDSVLEFWRYSAYNNLLRCLVNVPPLINFLIFFRPPDCIRKPPFITFKKIEFITGLLCYFLSLLQLFTPNFQGKLTCFCIYFSVTLCDSLCLFFPLLYNDFKLFLEFRPPIYFESPFIKFRMFFQPLRLLGPTRLFGT